MKKIFSLMLALVLVLSLAACGEAKPAASSENADPIRVACILSGPISDMSWNYTAHQGMLKIEALGAEIAYVENIDNSALGDCIDNYASDGYDVIFLSTNSYEEVALPLTAEYPETQFIIINGQTTAGNVTSYAVADEDQGFMQGVICAAVSESNKLGFIYAMDITPMLNGAAGFEQGAKYINKDVEVRSAATGDWSDVVKAKEVAKAMINDGVDALAPMCDSASLGVVEAGEEAGAYIAASGEGQETVAPNAVVCAVIKDTAIVYEQAYKAYVNGELTGDTGVVKLGAQDGVVYLSDWFSAADDVTDETKATVAAAYNALVAGEVAVEL